MHLRRHFLLTFLQHSLNFVPGLFLICLRLLYLWRLTRKHLKFLVDPLLLATGQRFMLQLRQFFNIIDVCQSLLFLLLLAFLTQVNCSGFLFALLRPLFSTFIFFRLQRNFRKFFKFLCTFLHLPCIFQTEVHDQPSVRQLHIV